MADADNVIKLVTRVERLRAEDSKAAEDAHRESMEILERALGIARERKLSGLAISLVFADGFYGHLIPLRTVDLARLIGATATMQQALIDSAEYE